MMGRLIALMDNEGSENGALIAEHGLSYLLERGGKRILFDCGASNAPWQNARRLGVDLHHLDAVVLSHSHWDHCVGYRELLERGWGCERLYTGPRFFERKYAADGPRCADISAGFTPEFLEEHGVTHYTVNGVQELFNGLYLISGFPRIHDFETIPSRFVRRTAEGFVPDDFCDETCLAFRQDGALIVLVGCSHPGILNMLRHIHTAMGLPIRAVFGGTHLGEADGARIAATAAALQELGLETVGFGHCSGKAAEQAVKELAGVRSCHLSTGSCIFFDD